MKLDNLIVLIVATTFADSYIDNVSESFISEMPGEDVFMGNTSTKLQQAIGGDLSLKMVMVEDGTPTGKCYCSCMLNSKPVFMEIDPETLPGNDMMTIV